MSHLRSPTLSHAFSSSSFSVRSRAFSHAFYSSTCSPPAHLSVTHLLTHLFSRLLFLRLIMRLLTRLLLFRLLTTWSPVCHTSAHAPLNSHASSPPSSSRERTAVESPLRARELRGCAFFSCTVAPPPPLPPPPLPQACLCLPVPLFCRWLSLVAHSKNSGIRE